MRLDKYLKVARLIKRRTIAKEVCDQGLVTVNERPAKASTEIRSGDVLTIRLGSRRLIVEILEVQDSIAAKDASSLYAVLSSERVEEDSF